MIYGNPGVNRDCGRCSSCVVHAIPDPRPLASLEPPPIPQINPSELTTEKFPAHLKLLVKDVEQVSKSLETAARSIWRERPKNPDSLFITPRCFLDLATIKKITSDFHLVTLEDVLQARVKGWRYWETSGQALWEAVESIGRDM